MKKTSIYMLVLLILVFTACKEKEEPKSIVNTSVVVNDVDVRLGMTKSDLENAFQDEHLEEDYEHASASGLCENVPVYWNVSNYEEINQVLGQNAYVYYNLDEERQLVFLEIVWWTDYDTESMFDSLIALYGTDYTKTWIDFVDVKEAYKWDMEDGVSILWWPEKESGEKPVLCMIYTDELTAEVDAPEEMPIPNN